MRDAVLLLVDVSYQCYRACAAHPLLRDSDDNLTGGVYGFFQNLGKALRETEATSVVLCVDSKPYVRSLEYPDYKLLRKQTADPELAERVADQKPKVLAAMSALGWDAWGVPGFESDDLIGLAVLRERHRYRRIYAMSKDSDLYQLFDVVPHFAVYAKDIADIWDGARLMREHGLSGAEYAHATALMGTHNGVEGIAGIGIKKAMQAVKDPARMRTLRGLHGDLIDRNRGLIRLPHAKLPRDSVPPPPRLGGHRKQLYLALGAHDIQTTASLIQEFERLWAPRYI